MADLDLKVEQNKQLVKLISDEDIEKIEEEIQFEVFKLVKKLKRKQITKSSNSSLKRSSTGSQKATPGKRVSLQFCVNYAHYGNMENRAFVFDVKTDSTVDQLIEQLEAKRLVRKIVSFVLFKIF